MGKISDKQLLEWTKPVWTELAIADCNPDIIPLSLCDACEIGFDKGFTGGITVTLAFCVSAAVGGSLYSLWKERKTKK